LGGTYLTYRAPFHQTMLHSDGDAPKRMISMPCTGSLGKADRLSIRQNQTSRRSSTPFGSGVPAPTKRTELSRPWTKAIPRLPLLFSMIWRAMSAMLSPSRRPLRKKGIYLVKQRVALKEGATNECLLHPFR